VPKLRLSLSLGLLTDKGKHRVLMQTTLCVQLGIITTADSVTIFHRQFSLSSVNVDSDVLQNMVQILWTKNQVPMAPKLILCMTGM